MLSLGLLGVLVTGTGCVSPWWNAFLSPQEVGNFRENRVSEIQQSISLRDKPVGVPGATDPTPEDLVATIEEYQVGPGDTISIRLLDFLQLGVETQLQPIIDELGYIDVPQIGWLQVDGMTPRQIQAEIVQQSKAAGIYPVDFNPTITVQILTRQHRTYNISGVIAVPGEYPIARPDLRLREAVNQAGALPDAVKVVYVFRNELRQKRFKPAATPMAPRPGISNEPPPAPAPPVTPEALSDMSQATGSPPASKPIAVPPPASRTSREPGISLPAEEVERDLMDAVAPATVPAKREAASPPPTMPTFIYVNNEFVEAPPAAGTATATQSLPATTPKAAPRPPLETSPSQPVDWEELASEGQQRVIRIPADRIRQGDPNYNIVVRHHDWIQLVPGQVGVFYIDGHVNRGGVYALNGEEMTLTQAIASAGGLNQIAWPTRCEIRRRIDGNREEITQWDLARIMAGQDPDLFIKKDDVVRVGTHAVAPLLATIRNSFRLTYGFGFVYDRNFGDIDAYTPQQNPRGVRQFERQQLGLLP
ncbi:MAG TPA: polysaccharide biosynthesis/export family protein [Phycisphaerae bacterium]|nr:polysaccharide biosynthesis/export family protein [Phycisphaerae bacterium]